MFYLTILIYIDNQNVFENIDHKNKYLLNVDLLMEQVKEIVQYLMYDIDLNILDLNNLIFLFEY
jgi:hypothetical protein